MVYLNRRRFLQTSAAATFAAGTSTLASLTHQKAFAANTTGYKALVGVFLFGGMDHVDTVLHYDQPSYDAMRAHRPGIMNAHGAARQRENLLRLQPDNAADLGGLEYALPQDLGGIHSMFESGEAAIVGSVGPLFEPTTREDMESRMVDLPPRLFSHNDQ
ncbi:MAG: twin-arginine translocation signal domain-containing protein, partial [Pseudomonadota bacterium]